MFVPHIILLPPVLVDVSDLYCSPTFIENESHSVRVTVCLIALLVTLHMSKLNKY